MKPGTWNPKASNDLRTLLLLLGAVVVFYSPGLLPGRVLLPLDILCGSLPWAATASCQGRVINNPVISDQVFQFYPWHEIIRRDGWRAAWWNPYAFGGAPMLANGQSAPLYPLNWLHFLLPPSWSYVLLAILRTAIAVGFTWAFARRRVSPAAAALAAMAYGFSYTFVFSVGYPLGDAMAWLPALLWALDPPRLLFVALFTGLELLAGQPESALVTFFVAGVWFLWQRPGLRQFLTGVLGVLAGLVLAAPQLLPLLQYVSLGAASHFRAQYNPLFYSAHTLIEFLTPEFFGTSSPAHRWGSNEGGFFGLLAFLLAATWILIRPRQAVREPFFWIFLASLAFIYRVPPVAWLMAWPLVKTIYVSKFWASATFAGAMLAARGLDDVIAKRIRLWICFGLWPVAGGLLALSSWAFADYIRALNLQRFEMWVAAKFLIFLLLSLAALRWRPATAAAIVFVECVIYLGRFNTASPQELLFPPTPSIGFLKKDQSRFRIMGDGVLPANTAGVYGLEDVRGYDAITYRPYFDYMTAIDPSFPDLAARLDLDTRTIGPDTLFQRDRFLRPLEKWGEGYRQFLHEAYYWNERLTKVVDSGMLDRLNVKYYLVPRGSRPPPGLDDYVLVFSAEVDVYQNPHVLPRAFVLGPGTAGVSPAFVLSHGPDCVIVQAKGPGKLILSDTWYPGWRADGRRVELVDGLFRGLTLDAGSQTVTFRFHPWSMRLP